MNKKYTLINRHVLFKTFILFISVCMWSITVFAQGEIRISGTVTDNAGEPIPGVNVLVKGSLIGVITDVDGKYSVIVPGKDAVLIFSFIGFTAFEQLVGDMTTIDVTLSEESQQIEEVVVVAYGTQKKVTVTGALSTIGTNELLKAPVPNLGHALAGNLPGLSAIQYTGQPGADDPTIFIRGIGSLDAGRSAPLFMVDGVERSFFRLDPNEIESISILKDASATAVFGVRGANGVILVTTKRGQPGKPKMSFSTSAGIQRPVRVIDFADSYEYAILFNEAERNDGKAEEDLTFKQFHIDAFRTNSDPLLYPNTDWVDMFIKPASLQTQHNINISGGTERVRYFTSIGALTQNGIFRSFETDYNANFIYQRYNYRANVDIDITSGTLMKVNLGGRIENTHEPSLFGDSGNDFRGFYPRLRWGLPFAGAGLHEGKHITASSDNIPFARGPLSNGDVFDGIYGRGYYDIMKNDINLDLLLTQKLDLITQGLSFTVKGSYNTSFTHTKNRTKSEPKYTAHRDENNELFFRQETEGSGFGFSESLGKSRNWYLEGSLNYARSFGKHNVTALALYNQWRDPYPDQYDYSNIPRGYVGLVGRVTYNFNTRYLLDFNVGYNGSENFHRDHRYGLFPAISGGWIISQENFMQNVGFIDHLKIRASYGLVGNDLYARARFFYLPDAYNPSSGGYNFGTISSSQPGATELRLGNKFVTWEKARKQNYGVDFSFLGSRLSGSFDYFIEKRNDILTSRNTIPGYIAVSMPVVNIGEVENKGFEVVLTWNQKINEFRYHIGFNVSVAKNMVVFKDEIPRNYDWRKETGKPVGQQFGYVFDGFATEERIASGLLPDHKLEMKPGNATYKDLNGDNVIDDDDVKDIGYPRYPELSGGFNLGFEYKNFDFSMMWAGAARVSRFVSGELRVPFGDTRNRTVLKYMVNDRWTPETAETAKIPRITFNHVGNNFQTNSDLWLKDASYLRMKNIQIGYTFRGNWLQKISLSNLRMFASGENLLLFDYLKISDPEQTDQANFNYPILQIVNVGLTFSF